MEKVVKETRLFCRLGKDGKYYKATTLTYENGNVVTTFHTGY